MRDASLIFAVPYQDEVIDGNKKISSTWGYFLRLVQQFLEPLGAEKVFPLENNISTAKDITGLSFDKAVVSQAIVEFLIQRITTDTEPGGGDNSTDLVISGHFHVVYKPKLNNWEIHNLSAPAEGYFTAATSDICTKSSHGFNLAQKVRVSSSGTLPAGLAAATDYWIIPVTLDTFKIASSFTNAHAGTAIDITSTGSGNHKITPITVSPNYGVSLTITSAGQVQYTSTNITGAPSISRIIYRVRKLAGKSALYSKAGG